MARKCGFIVVEGPHDVELVYRLLKPFGLGRVQLKANLDLFFHPLTEYEFPLDGDLMKRIPVPLFLQSGSHLVAVHAATGDTRLIETVEENALLIDHTHLTGVGVILDADSDKSPGDRYAIIRDGLRAKNFPFPEDAGSLSTTTPRFGAFVLPDNQAQGTLEDILLECGGLVYPSLLASATIHVDAASQDPSLLSEDLKELRKSAGARRPSSARSPASCVQAGPFRTRSRIIAGCATQPWRFPG